jgi:protease I
LLARNKDDIIDSGALYKDCEVVIDGNLVSSRSSSDLHAFGREMISITKHL